MENRSLLASGPQVHERRLGCMPHMPDPQPPFGIGPDSDGEIHDPV